MTVHFDARIDPLAPTTIHPRSWFITFGMGRPARGMFTEVLLDEASDSIKIATLDEVVRAVAVALYGTAWAFHYPPDDYELCIEPYSLARRERIVVTGIEEW